MWFSLSPNEHFVSICGDETDADFNKAILCTSFTEMTMIVRIFCTFVFFAIEHAVQQLEMIFNFYHFNWTVTFQADSEFYFSIKDLAPIKNNSSDYY